jgi:hypothetical protein
LLQGLAQFVDQARVLDGDNSLVGEGGGQLHLVVGEWPYASPLQIKDANRRSFPH